MPIKDFGKKLGDSLHGAVDTAKAKAAEVKMPDFKELGGKATEQVKSVFRKREGEKPDEPETAAQPVIAAVSVRSALKVIYYLMSADGTILHGEEEKFDAIGQELDPDFAANRDALTGECQKTLEDNTIDEEDHYDVLQDCVEAALLAPAKPDEAAITPKLLVWDLLTVAYSDEQYDETERRLLKYIVRKLGVDKAVFLEMESSYLTLMDIERELQWVKSTDRPYLRIEAEVNELNVRKNVVFESVKDLITL